MANEYNLVNATADGSGAVETFSQSFDATTSWGAASGGVYTIIILQSTHGKSVVPQVDLYEVVGPDFEKVDADIIINTLGDVSIKVPDVIDSRFAGKVVIL
jgi:hypothetical protein